MHKCRDVSPVFKKNARPCLCPAKCESIFGGSPLAGGPKIQQKSAPKCAFSLFESCLKWFNFLSIIRRLPLQIVSITLPLRVNPATISRPSRDHYGHIRHVSFVSFFLPFSPFAPSHSGICLYSLEGCYPSFFPLFFPRLRPILPDGIRLSILGSSADCQSAFRLTADRLTPFFINSHTRVGVCILRKGCQPSACQSVPPSPLPSMFLLAFISSLSLSRTNHPRSFP